jgi:hypothetical protein
MMGEKRGEVVEMEDVNRWVEKDFVARAIAEELDFVRSELFVRSTRFIRGTPKAGVRDIVAVEVDRTGGCLVLEVELGSCSEVLLLLGFRRRFLNKSSDLDLVILSLLNRIQICHNIVQDEESIHTVKTSGSIAAKLQTMLRISGGNFGNRVIVGRITCSLSKDSKNKERLSMAIVRS